MWSAISGLLGIADKVAGSLFETEEEKSRAKVAILDAMSQVDLAQIGINTVEAQSRHLWTSGWRPAIGWSCSVAVFFQFVFNPLLQWLSSIFGLAIPPMPSFENYIFELMAGMLGIAGLRSWDKQKGLTK